MSTLQKRYNPHNKGIDSIEDSWEEAVVDHETKEAIITIIRRGWMVRLGNWEYRLKPVSEFQRRTWLTEWQDIVPPVHLSEALAELCRDRSPSAIMMVHEGARYDHCTMYRRNPNYNG